MRSQFANLRVLVLPGGATSGIRIVINGIDGSIQFYDAADNLVGQLAPGEWFIGDSTGARITLDPLGGMRIRNLADVLVGVIDQGGYSLRDGTTGNVLAELTPGTLVLSDPAGSDNILLSTSSASSWPTPSYGSATESDPGTTFVIPALKLATADDLSIGHACAWEAGYTGASTWTPPGGWTERLDAIDTSGGGTLNPTIGTLDPAAGTAATFTNTDGTYQSGLTTHVLVRGGGATSPSYRSIGLLGATGFATTTATTLAISITKPTGVATGDVLIALVSMGNAVGSVPVGWTTPDGWRFLGANFLIRGSGSTQSTLAVGAWYKPIADAAAEPATYDLTINFGAGRKTIHAAIVAVQNPVTFPGGPVISIGGHPIKRLLDEKTLTAANLELANFTSIPAGYHNLQVVYYGLSDTSADVVRNIQIRFNGDSANNYAWRRTRNAVTDQGLAAPGIRVGEIDGASVGHVAAGYFDVLQYATAAAKKVAISQSHSEQVGTLIGHTGVGQWNSSAAINAVRILTDSGLTQFDVGSVARLYGW